MGRFWSRLRDDHEPGCSCTRTHLKRPECLSRCEGAGGGSVFQFLYVRRVLDSFGWTGSWRGMGRARGGVVLAVTAQGGAYAYGRSGSRVLFCLHASWTSSTSRPGLARVLASFLSLSKRCHTLIFFQNNWLGLVSALLSFEVMQAAFVVSDDDDASRVFDSSCHRL